MAARSGPFFFPFVLKGSYTDLEAEDPDYERIISDHLKMPRDGTKLSVTLHFPNPFHIASINAYSFKTSSVHTERSYTYITCEGTGYFCYDKKRGVYSQLVVVLASEGDKKILKNESLWFRPTETSRTLSSLDGRVKVDLDPIDFDDVRELFTQSIENQSLMLKSISKEEQKAHLESELSDLSKVIFKVNRITFKIRSLD
jgi:hypothetical protein